jgi:hypothetical protein
MSGFQDTSKDSLSTRNKKDISRMILPEFIDHNMAQSSLIIEPHLNITSGIIA